VLANLSLNVEEGMVVALVGSVPHLNSLRFFLEIKHLVFAQSLSAPFMQFTASIDTKSASSKHLKIDL
jgi:hypothetical protein